MTAKQQYDVTIIGGSGGFDLVLAEQLSAAGLVCVVLRMEKHRNKSISEFSKYHKHYPSSKIVWLKNRFSFLTYARNSRLVISFTGKLIGYLHVLWPLRHWLGLPPVVQWFTGSDATELITVNSWAGRFFRQYLHFTSLNIGVAYPHALENYVRYRIPRLVFLPFPYFLPQSEETDFQDKNGMLRFFHPSHLDWKVNDPGEHRNSSKGNDRFIRAFARALKSGLKAQCVILDRGADRDVAKELIRSLEVEDAFVWKPHLSRDELVQEYRRADVVVDQFDVGAFGGIAIEAMALGKPVLVYVNSEAHRINFDVFPPVLNAFSEDEIYQQIMKCIDPDFLKTVGMASKDWAYKYQSPDSFIPRLLFYFSALTGKSVSDYFGTH